MGIYDRDYSREEPAGGLRGALALWGSTQVLIALNAVVFILWLAAHDSEQMSAFMERHFLVSRDGVLNDFYFHTLITCAFSQMDLWHILFNMYALWLFGRELETIYGPRNLIVLYVLCGIAGSLGHIAWTTAPALGASGATVGITILAAIYNPSQPVNIFFISMTLRTFAIVIVLMDLVGTLQGGDHVAHTAHLSGALMALVFLKLDLRVFKDTPTGKLGLWERFKRFFRRKPKLRVVKPDPFADVRIPDALEAEPSIDSSTAARVDALLAKIKREGMNALTEEERAFLRTSSEKYRR